MQHLHGIWSAIFMLRILREFAMSGFHFKNSCLLLSDLDSGKKTQKFLKPKEICSATCPEQVVNS